MEERLDKLLLARNLVSSRVRAEEMIEKVGVLVNGKLVQKPGKKFPPTIVIELIEEEIPWVSRGALKLLKAIETWNIDVKQKTVLDIGASTGGFTEVCLHHGSKKVFCVDVGSKQLHAKILSNPLVVNLEKTHVRKLTEKLITDPIDVCVIDVSFISLKQIFPFIHRYIVKDGVCIALIKPQFEVGKEHISKGGIVKNKRLYPEVIEQIKDAAKLANFDSIDVIDSPILGGDGNHEFLIYLKKITK